MSATLIEVLLTDREEARALMARFDDLPMEQREEAFWTPVASLAKHEFAEEGLHFGLGTPFAKLRD